MPTLLILRHAKSDWDSNAESDFDRPLAKRGLRAAPRVGALLKGTGLRVDRIVSSPAVRARQTAEIVRESAGIKAKIEFEKSIYEATTKELYRVLATQPGSARVVMIVGHNPGFESLAGSLCGPDGRGANLRFTTAALACVDLQIADWSQVAPGAGTLLWFAVPKMLGIDGD